MQLNSPLQDSLWQLGARIVWFSHIRAEFKERRELLCKSLAAAIGVDRVKKTRGVKNRVEKFGTRLSHLLLGRVSFAFKFHDANSKARRALAWMRANNAIRLYVVSLYWKNEYFSRMVKNCELNINTSLKFINFFTKNHILLNVKEEHLAKSNQVLTNNGK